MHRNPEPLQRNAGVRLNHRERRGRRSFPLGRQDDVFVKAASHGSSHGKAEEYQRPFPCDHTSDTEVEALFARVKQEQGRMDLLVNNAWGGYEQHDHRKFSAPFYEQSMRHWNGMFTAGVRATLLASRIGAPLMMGQRHGLIVNITAWDREQDFGKLI